MVDLGKSGKVRSQPKNRQVLRPPCPSPNEQSRPLGLSMADGNSIAYSTFGSKNYYGEEFSRDKGIRAQWYGIGSALNN